MPPIFFVFVSTCNTVSLIVIPALFFGFVSTCNTVWLVAWMSILIRCLLPRANDWSMLISTVCPYVRAYLRFKHCWELIARFSSIFQRLIILIMKIPFPFFRVELVQTCLKQLFQPVFTAHRISICPPTALLFVLASLDGISGLPIVDSKAIFFSANPSPSEGRFMSDKSRKQHSVRT